MMYNIYIVKGRKSKEEGMKTIRRNWALFLVVVLGVLVTSALIMSTALAGSGETTPTGGGVSTPVPSKPLKELVWDTNFTVQVETVEVQIVSLNTNIKVGQTFTATVKIVNLLPGEQVVVYDFASDAQVSGAVMLDADGEGPLAPQPYVWGQLTTLRQEHLLYLSLAPAITSVGATDPSTFSNHFQVFRWLGPRG